MPAAADMPSFSSKTKTPISVATTGSIVAVMLALPASVYLSPPVKHTYGITLVTKLNTTGTAVAFTEEKATSIIEPTPQTGASTTVAVRKV